MIGGRKGVVDEKWLEKEKKVSQDIEKKAKEMDKEIKKKETEAATSG